VHSRGFGTLVAIGAHGEDHLRGSGRRAEEASYDRRVQPGLDVVRVPLDLLHE